MALLDDAYQLAGSVSYWFGYFDLAALATERAQRVAVRSGDPLRAAVAAFMGTTVRVAPRGLRRGAAGG